MRNFFLRFLSEAELLEVDNRRYNARIIEITDYFYGIIGALVQKMTICHFHGLAEIISYERPRVELFY